MERMKGEPGFESRVGREAGDEAPDRGGGQELPLGRLHLWRREEIF